MFGWFRKKKAAHPLADIDAMRELVAALPAGDPVRALGRIGGWLDSITQAREIGLEDRWAVVDLLDQSSLAHRRKLAQDYLSGARAKKTADDKHWHAALDIWRGLSAAYARCVTAFKVEGASAKALDAEVPALIAARALRACGQQLKWAYLRHAPPEARIWRDLGTAYLFAETQGVVALRADLHAEDRGAFTAQEELLKALMLAMASPYNLEAPQLHLAERFVAHFCGRFVLAGNSAPELTCVFDLATGRPPGRAREGMTPSATLRCFGPGDSAQGLAGLMQDIKAKDGIPGDVNLGGNFDTDTVLAVLAHLARIWGAAPPERRAERSAAATRVTVVPGLPNILRCLELAAGGGSLDPKSFAEQENWEVLDRSDTGYGVLVPEERGSFEFDPVTGVRTASGDWLRIGALVALREDGAAAWRIGVVRRILTDDSNRRRAGIGVIAGEAAVVRLAPASGPRANEPERRRAAVLMAHVSEGAAEAIVLMRAGHFMTTQRLAMQFESRDYVLEPEALIEGGEDFDCASFTIAHA